VGLRPGGSHYPEAVLDAYRAQLADPLELWRPYAPGITGHGLEGISHFLVEEAPLDLADEVTTFLTGERFAAPVSGPS
jgi:hypothetical protein